MFGIKLLDDRGPAARRALDQELARAKENSVRQRFCTNNMLARLSTIEEAQKGILRAEIDMNLAKMKGSPRRREGLGGKQYNAQIEEEYRVKVEELEGVIAKANKEYSGALSNLGLLMGVGKKSAPGKQPIVQQVSNQSECEGSGSSACLFKATCSGDETELPNAQTKKSATTMHK